VARCADLILNFLVTTRGPTALSEDADKGEESSAARRPVSVTAIVLASISVALAIPIFVTFFEQGIVPRLPTAVLSTGLMLLAFLSIIAGLVLDTVTKGRREMKLVAYLQQRPPGERPDGG